MKHLEWGIGIDGERCRAATSQSRGVIPSGRKLDMGCLACAVWMAPTHPRTCRPGREQQRQLRLVSSITICTSRSAGAATSPSSSALHPILRHPSTEAIAGTWPRADWRPQLWISKRRASMD